LSFFAGNMPEINRYLPEKPAILPSSSNGCPRILLQKLDDTSTRMRTKALRMRSWWQPLTAKEAEQRKKPENSAFCRQMLIVLPEFCLN